jgi:RNA polymerase sigma-70 factor, ECF subfamily
VSASRASDGLCELMQRYVDGDRHAFAELHDRIEPRLRAFLVSRFGGAPATEDLVQVTMLKAHLARHRFRPHGPDGPDSAVMAWYFAIARNAARDHLRRQHRFAQRFELGGDDTTRVEATSMPPDVETILSESEEEQAIIEDVQAAIAQLPPTQREVVELHKLEGMSMADIADRLKIREGAVRVRAHRAYRALATLLTRKPKPGGIG